MQQKGFGITSMNNAPTAMGQQSNLLQNPVQNQNLVQNQNIVQNQNFAQNQNLMQNNQNLMQNNQNLMQNNQNFMQNQMMNKTIIPQNNSLFPQQQNTTLNAGAPAFMQNPGLGMNNMGISNNTSTNFPSNQSYTQNLMQQPMNMNLSLNNPNNMQYNNNMNFNSIQNNQLLQQPAYYNPGNQPGTLINPTVVIPNAQISNPDLFNNVAPSSKLNFVSQPNQITLNPTSNMNTNMMIGQSSQANPHLFAQAGPMNYGFPPNQNNYSLQNGTQLNQGLGATMGQGMFSNNINYQQQLVPNMLPNPAYGTKNIFDQERFKNYLQTPNEKFDNGVAQPKNFSGISQNLSTKFNNDNNFTNETSAASTSSLPYNPFSGLRRSNIVINQQNQNRSNNIYPSILRRKEEIAIQNKDYLDNDNMEIILTRPKITDYRINRARSTSPVSRNQTLNTSKIDKPEYSIYNQSVRIRLIVVDSYESKPSKELELRIFKGEKIITLKTKAIEQILQGEENKAISSSRRLDTSTFTHSNELKVNADDLKKISDNSNIIYNSRILDDSKTIENSITLSEQNENIPVVTLVLDRGTSNINNTGGVQAANDEAISNKFNGFYREQTKDLSDVKSTGIQSPGNRNVPKLTKLGYKCNPSIEEMKRMSDRELQQIENFTIENEHGKVEFDGKTDVRGLDIDDIVFIQPGMIEVYPIEESKPRRGEKLNKPSTLTLYNCRRSDFCENPEKAKQKMERQAAKRDQEFIDFDPINCVYRMRVKHFTKYAFPTAEDDDNQGQEEDNETKSPQFPMQDQAQQQYMQQYPGFKINLIQQQQHQENDMRNRHQYSAEKLSDDEGSEYSLGQAPVREFQENKILPRIKEEYKEEESIKSEQAYRNGIEEEHQNNNDNDIEEDDISGGTDPSAQFDKRHASKDQYFRKKIRGNDGRPILSSRMEEEIFDEEEAPVIQIEQDQSEHLEENSAIEKENAKHFKREEVIRERKIKTRDVYNNSEEGVLHYMNVITKLNKQIFEGNVEKSNMHVISIMKNQNRSDGKEFYLYRSCRVGWFKGNLCVPNFKDPTKIDIHQIIVHKKIFNESPEKYEKIAKKLYEPLFKEISELTTANSLIRMESLSIGEYSDKLSKLNFKFPTKAEFIKALAVYIDKVLRDKSEWGEEMLNMLDIDLEIWSLFNALFGNYAFDLKKFAERVNSPEFSAASTKDYMRLSSGIFDDNNDSILENIKRKQAVSKWIERKAMHILDFHMGRKDRSRKVEISNSDRILMYLSANQITKAVNFAIEKNLDRLAISLVIHIFVTYVVMKFFFVSLPCQIRIIKSYLENR